MEIECSKITAKDYSKLAKSIEKFSTRMAFDIKVYIFTNSDSNNIRDKYEIISELKESTFSHVYLARNIKTEKLFCIKKIKDDKNFFDQHLQKVQHSFDQSTYHKFHQYKMTDQCQVFLYHHSSDKSYALLVRLVLKSTCDIST